MKVQGLTQLCAAIVHIMKYSQVLASKNMSFQESNPVIGIRNNYRAGIIVSLHFFIRAVVNFGINLNSPEIISLCTYVAIMVIFMRS